MGDFICLLKNIFIFYTNILYIFSEKANFFLGEIGAKRPIDFEKPIYYIGAFFKKHIIF